MGTPRSQPARTAPAKTNTTPEMLFSTVGSVYGMPGPPPVWPYLAPRKSRATASWSFSKSSHRRGKSSARRLAFSAFSCASARLRVLGVQAGPVVRAARVRVRQDLPRLVHQPHRLDRAAAVGVALH